MNNKSLSFYQLLSQLGKMIESGKASNALPTILKLQKQLPGEPNILHLAAATQESLDNKHKAKELFIKSLRVKSDQPHVHNNFANFLKKQAEIEAARYHYQQAIHYSPNFAEAWRNLAILEFEADNLDAAYKHALKAVGLTPNLPAALTLLGNICRKNDQLLDAIHFFQKAKEKDPRYLKAIYGLAITYSELEKPEKALALFEEALTLAPTMNEALYSKALAELNLGRYSLATKTLEELVNINPLHVDAHKTLNEVYWQLGDRSLFCKSYLKAPRDIRENNGITISHIESLIAAGLIENAQSTLEAQIDSNKNFELIFLQARIEEEKGELKNALKIYENVALMQSSPSMTKQYLMALIKAQEFEKADKLVNQALRNSPDDQLLWAIQGTCWKILKDERYLWLNENSSYVRQYTIPTPKGFSNLNEFLLSLKEELLSIHNLKERPLFQSVRSGVQTPGRLFHKNIPIIHSLKESLREVVSDYIFSLPKDIEHPLLGRKSSSFKFSGSWSVALQNGGHHVSHVHPQGWISSAFYVEVPPPTSKLHQKDAGDIYFGKSPHQLGNKDFIEKQITPTKGALVLFPSYTWHGTIPLPSKAKHLRITTPFDVIPSHK
ncbi:tetratricopeptide repeat protein [Microbulbifer sp. CnH-101-E]|uniref:tetratricopeptide repeat protein n=1 Tax=unclassified Microbulbifer TaxID=2619833 RepID=UPI0040398F0F